MTTVEERRQKLHFDSSWEVSKWDASREFVGSLENALHGLPGEGTKAADVVGIRAQRSKPRILIAAEFKDFDDPSMPPEAAAEAALAALSDPLARNIIRKVIDTLCGATFAHDTENGRMGHLDEWRAALALSTTRILILVCVEVPKARAAAIGPWTTEPAEAAPVAGAKHPGPGDQQLPPL